MSAPQPGDVVRVLIPYGMTAATAPAGGLELYRHHDEDATTFAARVEEHARGANVEPIVLEREGEHLGPRALLSRAGLDPDSVVVTGMEMGFSDTPLGCDFCGSTKVDDRGVCRTCGAHADEREEQRADDDERRLEE